jgi:hypothetical protein
MTLAEPRASQSGRKKNSEGEGWCKAAISPRDSDPGLHGDGREADGRRVPIDVHRSEGLRKDVLTMFGRIKNGSRP